MSESLYERAFEAAPAGIAVHDPKTETLTEVNQAYADALGYERSTLIGGSLDSLVAESDRDTLRRATEAALDGESTRADVVVPHVDGPDRRLSMEFGRLTDAGDVRLVSTVRAAADREGADEGEQLSERRLKVALDGTDTGVWEWDMETDEVHWTDSMEQLFGVEPGAFEGTFEAFSERVHPDDRSAVERAIETAVAEGELFQADYRIQRDDGEQRWVHARAELQNGGNDSGMMVGIVTDITDQKRNEQQYRGLVERLPDAYYTIDSDWRITFCNEVAAERLDTSVEEIRGAKLWEVFPEARDGSIETRFRQVIRTDEPDSFEYQHESDERWVRIQVYPYEDGLAVLSTDISEKHQELTSVLDVAPIALYRVDDEGIFREARGELLSRLGLAPEDLLGESIWELYADDEAVIEAAARALDGETLRYTLTQDDITLETQYTPVYNGDELTGVIGVSMDVTELHRQRERMEFFNSILRHDVLNGMTVIKMRAELLADQLEGDHQQYAQTIVDWCNTTTNVVKRVRRVVDTLATPEEEHQLSRIDVSAILDRKGRELRTAYPEAEFDFDVPEGLHVRADQLLTDVLGNVLTNSIEHNDPEGLRVEVTAATDADTVQIRIADDGTGIEDDRKESVFRRGETSARESGSGFGLFFVDVMIEKYGGEVWVEDSDSGGACFVIELSLAEPGDAR